MLLCIVLQRRFVLYTKRKVTGLQRPPLIKHLYSEVRVTGGFSGFSCYADVKLSQRSFDKMPRREILNKQLKYEFIPSLPARISGDAGFLFSL